eukprot:6168264-Pleurochrysis_carterae.AAC.1
MTVRLSCLVFSKCLLGSNDCKRAYRENYNLLISDQATAVLILKLINSRSNSPNIPKYASAHYLKHDVCILF